jgi:hypothetical protein
VAIDEYLEAESTGALAFRALRARYGLRSFRVFRSLRNFRSSRALGGLRGLGGHARFGGLVATSFSYNATFAAYSGLVLDKALAIAIRTSAKFYTWWEDSV